ncbi:hypothetical protein OSTOST_10327 [Ostertagia ostertagi]
MGRIRSHMRSNSVFRCSLLKDGPPQFWPPWCLLLAVVVHMADSKVHTLIIEYDEAFFHNGESDNTYIVSIIAHLISMTTNVANPILYAWLNPSFKEMLLTTLRRKTRKQDKHSAKDTIIRVNKSSENTQEKAF